ncbi:MAG: YihY/virulence factor BrkB family protein [Solirubrobacterales bacterium]|nr:YihY/virulence factor BrkB family protein [Solirubrobacterales bacterium]
MSCTNCDENHPEHPNDAPLPVSEQWKHLHWLQAFWTRAWRENITGLSGMVAYNLMLAIFPFAFLVLFIFSQVLQIEGVEAGIVGDLQRLFPNAEQGTLNDVISAIRNNSATLGIAAAIGSLWIGASFWGSMDTAFCRIYHVECRGWWEQKRFSLGMLLVVTIFLLGSVLLPALEGALIRQTDNLPFGLNEVQNLDNAVLLAVTLTLNFSVAAVIYWAVPKGHMPWLAVWPGALFTTLVAATANWLFPVYLNNVSALNRFGSTIGFILIALFWFYLVALTMLAGAVINSLRHEYHDTGRMPYGILSRAQLLARVREEEEKAAHQTMAEPYRSLMTGEAWPADGKAGAAADPGEADEGEAETKVIPLRRRNNP